MLKGLFTRTVRRQRELTTRALQTRPDSVNLDQRSIEAVMTTENPVPVFDWERGRIIDEILLARGAELPDQLVLLHNHNRSSMDSVFGSARDLRVEGTATVCRVYFAAGDEGAERAWQKYRDGHARDVSIGYEPVDYVDIQPGERRAVLGKEYRARDRVLRVTTKWVARELSLTPIGADEAAKTRSESGRRPIPREEEQPMNPRLRKYLESIGLRTQASEEEARTFLGLLSGRSGQIATILAREDPEDETSRLMTRMTLEGLKVDPDDPTKELATRSETQAGPEATGQRQGELLQAEPLRVFEAAPNADAIRAEGAEQEHARVLAIRELADDRTPPELVDQAIRERWDEARTAREFLRAHREDRTPPVGCAPSIHVRGHDQDCTLAALGAAMMIRENLDPVRDFVRVIDGSLVRRREDQPTTDLEQAAERGYQYRDWSLIDICREACRLDGIRVPTARGEMIRAAVSGSALTNIFSTNVSAQLLAGYTDAADSTVGWVSEADVANFQTNERVAMGKFGALKKLSRGKTAEHLDDSDSKEEYKIARYAGQFVIDEQDIIDDRLGAVDQVAPRDMGSSAAQLRPNLVYAILLANAALSDGGALFNATAETTAGGHANLTQDALDAAGLEAALIAMSKHRIRTRPLNVKARFLIVPQDLRFTAAVLLKSITRDYDGTDGIYNPLAFEELNLRSDDRIGAAGVVDPATGTKYTGSATNWFLAGRPGENGAKTIEVGYLRGTGRRPQMRSFVLTQGQYGVGFDINLDIGAKALCYRALHYSDGTS